MTLGILLYKCGKFLKLYAWKFASEGCLLCQAFIILWVFVLVILVLGILVECLYDTNAFKISNIIGS